MREETGAGRCRARSSVICERYHNALLTSISIFLKPVVSYNRPEGQDKIKRKKDIEMKKMMKLLEEYYVVYREGRG